MSNSRHQQRIEDMCLFWGEDKTILNCTIHVTVKESPRLTERYTTKDGWLGKVVRIG